MHQLTFFVGPVNFYYKYKDKYYCEEMNTGDSNYIPPFIPHSFTSRNVKEESFIVAVTFGGNLKNVLPRVSALENKMVDFINYLIKGRSNVLKVKNEISHLKEFNNKNFEKDNIDNLSEDLSGVLVKEVGDYEIIKKGLYKAASSNNYFSGARGFHIKSESEESILLTNPCDSFLFNYGSKSVDLENITLNKNVVLECGDSAFVACGDEYQVITKSSCSLFLVTLDLYLTPSIIDEIISFSDHNRLYTETKQWFNG